MTMDYRDALLASRVLDVLSCFGPRVVGTLPIDLSVATSDIDIVCEAPDPNACADVIWREYRNLAQFQMFRWREGGRPVVARFEFESWRFELFADPRPVEQQQAWRHFDVERRLLALDDGRLRTRVARLRGDGFKTEPAFAHALSLGGDPYETMLSLYPESDAELMARLAGI